MDRRYSPRGPRDPAFGMEYNKIQYGYRVSKHLFDIDIARTSMVVKDRNLYVNVQEEALYINSERGLVDRRRGRFMKGHF